METFKVNVAKSLGSVVLRIYDSITLFQSYRVLHWIQEKPNNIICSGEYRAQTKEPLLYMPKD